MNAAVKTPKEIVRKTEDAKNDKKRSSITDRQVLIDGLNRGRWSQLSYRPVDSADVADHPYHTVTDAYGAYEIRDVPAGTYTLRVWQEELGTREQPVTVKSGETATADVTFAAREASR